MTLSDGKMVSSHGTVTGFVSKLTSNSGADPYFGTSSSLAYTLSGNLLAMTASAAYQIDMLGAPTGYWIKTDLALVTLPRDVIRYSCHVYRGDPTQGAQLVDPSPFTCDTRMARQGDLDLGVITYQVGLNKRSEVQGNVITRGSASLTNGYWEATTPYAVNGATSLGQYAKTYFVSVLREGDHVPANPDLARDIFDYQLVLNGVNTKYWVMGYAQNNRGATYQHTSECNIYLGNPFDASGGPFEAKPVTVSPFTCEMSSYNVSGRGIWHVDFTVGTPDLTVLPDTPANTVARNDLLKRYCTADLVDCDLNLATVTKTWGPAEIASSPIANTGITDVVEKQAYSRTATTANTVGVKISVAGDLFKVYKTSVETNYSLTITKSTTYSGDRTITVKPGYRAFWTVRAELIHAVGNVLVRDGNHVYDIVGVGADFPQPDEPGNYTLVSQAQKLGPDSGALVLPLTLINSNKPKKAMLNGSVHTVNGDSASGALSLVDGSYMAPPMFTGTVVNTATPGPLTIAADSSAAFSSSQVVDNTAVSGAPLTSAAFVYRIQENGQPTDYWVSGYAQTWDWMQNGGPAASCQVFQGNPADGGHLAGADAPYQCLSTIKPAGTGGVDDATFTVSPAMASLTPGGSASSQPPSASASNGGSAQAGSGGTGVSGTVLVASVTGGPSGLAETGSSIPVAPIAGALLALLAGGALVILRRRRRHGQRD